MQTRGLVVALSLLALTGGCRRAAKDAERGAPTATAAPVPESGGFVPRRDVDAVDQPDSRRVVSHLQAATRYALLKRGGPGGVWCKVDVGAAGAGWVPCAESAESAPIASESTPPPSPPPPAPTAPSPGSGFSYYVLTLSWSPAFCATPAGSRSSEQCGPGRQYAFVVHGLWPQNEHGWPDNCPAGSAPAAPLVSRMLDIMPSRQLVQHEWEKHGTCSGLSADDYFARVRSAYQSIRIPDAYVAPKQPFTTDLEHVVSAFTAANPRLTASAMAVHCKGELDEVRICLDKELTPRPCASDVRSACRGSVTVPPLR